MDNRGPIEVALSSDLRGAPYYFSLWDIHTGAQLVVFKGNKGNPIARCLKLIDNNYFITATDNVLQIWSIYNKKCQDQKLFLPGRPSTLCTSPCGNYLVVAISEMIYIWQLHSGNLLAHTQRHYQTVTVLKINQDGTFLFSGGEDGMVLVWPFADLISGTHNTGALNLGSERTDTGVNEPRFTWQHGGPITDLHVTNGGRCITATIDKTINIYSYANGRLLYCVTGWPSPIWCVVMNKNETKIFLGGQDGNIYELLVSSLSLSLFNSSARDNESLRKPILVGHKDKVTNLLVSMDGSLLISASLDSTCKIWDIYHGKMLRDVKHQAPLANLSSLLVPDGFALTSIAQSHMKPPLLVKPLKRSLYKTPREGTLMKSDLFEEANTTIIYSKNQVGRFDPSKSDVVTRRNSSTIEGSILKTPKVNDSVNHIESSKQNDSDESTLQTLKSRLRELYLLSAEKIFQDVAQEALQPYKRIVDDIDATVSKVVRKDKKLGSAATKRKEKPDDDKIRVTRSASKKVQVTNGVKKVKKVKKGSSLFV